MRIAIVSAPFQALADLAAFEAANLDSGAVASFVGRCRAQSSRGAVQALQLQHYPDFTEREIERFTASVAEKFSLNDVLIVHRVGEILAGEAIVLVAAASAHRAAAFDAVQALIDFLKTDAPLWKRELTETGAAWIEPTAHDHERRKASKA